MADGGAVHKPANKKGGLDTAQKSWSVPLLPYEKQLISALGCSEEEYKWFTTEVRRREAVRPAEYAHVPDVRMEVATIIAIVSLVIGLASTAVSFFLTPKPKPLNVSGSNRRGGRSRPGVDINGADRFAPTFGFNTQAELANYGEPIPIVFGRYDTTLNTGGVLHTPRLVWSRAFSHGTQQSVKLLFVVGEQGVDDGTANAGIAPPKLQGIFLGNGSLGSTYKSDYAFYWKRNTTFGGITRIRAADLAYGSRAADETGDYEENDDVFSCPTANGSNDTGFSSAHSLTNNTEFGCYSPIPNGTPYRVPWQVVSIPRTRKNGGNSGDFNSISEDDEFFVKTRERIKIAGNENATVDTKDVWNLGMKGTGRHYSRRMGAVELLIKQPNGTFNSVRVSGGVGGQEFDGVKVGDKMYFRISQTELAKDRYYREVTINDKKEIESSVSVDDINTTIAEMCIAADDSLQVGEIFMMRRSVWKVVKRLIPIWKPGLNQRITLKCIEVTGSDKVGLVNTEMITRDTLRDDTDTTKLHVGTVFYPLMRVAFAVVRNTRACDVTEIGIRSTVYQRLNGLPNFQNLPTPAQLRRSDRRQVARGTGSINTYTKRASVFTIFVRPAGSDVNGLEYEWKRIEVNFAVVGNTPITRYNSIQIKHPSRAQYEYRFVPKDGADVARNDAAIFWVLNATRSAEDSAMTVLTTSDAVSGYGTFTITAPGYTSYQSGIRYCREFFSLDDLSTVASAYKI